MALRMEVYQCPNNNESVRQPYFSARRDNGSINRVVLVTDLCQEWPLKGWPLATGESGLNEAFVGESAICGFEITPVSHGDRSQDLRGTIQHAYTPQC